MALFFVGAEIKAWIEEQIKNHTSHECQARYMTRFFNIKDDQLYFINMKPHYEHCKKRGKFPMVYKLKNF